MYNTDGTLNMKLVTILIIAVFASLLFCAGAAKAESAILALM